MRQVRGKISGLCYLQVDRLGCKLICQIGRQIRLWLHRVLHDIFAGIEALYESHVALLPQTRTSHPISKLLRPVFQHKRIKSVLGANLAGAVILASSVSASPGAVEAYPEAEVPVLEAETDVLTTESRFQKPLETMDMSQGFSGLHRGIDLRAPGGTPIRPVAAGKVAEAVYGRFGYGYYVLLDHEDGFSSLYAHMRRIEVNPGDEVTKETVLGEVGTTGWATGSHLHLEIYEKGAAINPLQVMPLN